MFRKSDREKRLAAALLNEKAAHATTRKKLAIAQAEVEGLAAVIARDRQRIKAETAAYARKQADSENHGRTDESIE